MLVSRFTTARLATMEDSMEISSEWNAEDDIDIDIDLTAGHEEGEEDYMIEDIGDDVHPAHDDLMEDDDGHSFNMADAEGMEDHDLIDEQPADMSFEGDVDIHDTVFDDAEHAPGPAPQEEEGMGTSDGIALEADDFTFDNYEDAEIYIPEGEGAPEGEGIIEGANGERTLPLNEAGPNSQDENNQGTDPHDLVALTEDKSHAAETVVGNDAASGELEPLEEEEQSRLSTLDVVEEGADIWDLDEEEEPVIELAGDENNEEATTGIDVPADTLAKERNDSHSSTPLATGTTSVGNISHEDTPAVASNQSPVAEEVRSPTVSAGTPTEPILATEVNSNEHEQVSDEAFTQPDEASLDVLHKTPRRQEVQIWYNGSEYSLFSMDDSDDPETFFLSDFSITEQPLDVFFSGLRNVIGHELTPAQRLGFVIEELGLELDERSVPDDVTLGSIMNLRDKLFRNDGTTSMDDLQPIYMILEIKIDFSAQFQILSVSAKEGTGLSELVNHAESDSHESPINEDGLAQHEFDQQLESFSEDGHVEEGTNTIDTENLQPDNAETATGKIDDINDSAQEADPADTYHEDDLIDYSEDEIEPEEAPGADEPNDEYTAKNEEIRQHSVARKLEDASGEEQEQEQQNGEDEQSGQEQVSEQGLDHEYETHETTDSTFIEEKDEDDYATELGNTGEDQPEYQNDSASTRVDTEEKLIGDEFENEINFGEDEEVADSQATPKQDTLNLEELANRSGSAGSDQTLEASNEVITSTIDEIDYDDDDEIEVVDTINESSSALQTDNQSISSSKRARSDERFEEGLETESQDIKRSRS